MKIKVENDMRPHIVSWLTRNGYYDAHECMIGGYCDVIGCKWGERKGRKKPELLEMICIELKLRDISGVISQAIHNHYHCNLSYCAMPVDFCRRMRDQSVKRFIEAGVGLLAVNNTGEIRTLVYSCYKNQIPHIVFRNRLWAFKLRNRRPK